MCEGWSFPQLFMTFIDVSQEQVTGAVHLFSVVPAFTANSRLNLMDRPSIRAT